MERPRARLVPGARKEESVSAPFCCPMREKFVVGIVAARADLPTPIDAADFIDFDQKTPDGLTIIRIKYCPFCGKPVAGPLRVA